MKDLGHFKTPNQKVVCVISTTHELFDDRIYWKQGVSLKNNGYEVHHIFVKNNCPENHSITEHNIYFHQFNRETFVPNVLLNYLLKKTLPLHDEFNKILQCVKQINPSVIQLCDVRLLRIIKKLKKISNAKIICDVREPTDDNLIDIRMKNWKIPLSLKVFYAKYIQKWEYNKLRESDYIIGVDDKIESRITQNVPDKPYTTIYNYTNLPHKRKYVSLKNRTYDAIYVGGISEARGAKTIAISTRILKKKFPEIKILLLGNIFMPTLKEWLNKFILEHDLSQNLIIKNHVPYHEVSDYYNHSKIGLNILHNTPAHRGIIQIKIFEYMNYGLPIITSNFGRMQDYVIENKVGYCIPPETPAELAKCIDKLLTNHTLLKELGSNGVQAIDQKYNWKLMEEKYLKIMNQLSR